LAGSGIGAFATKDAGTNKAVTASGYTLTGADAANYSIVQPTGLTATIARADLALSGVTATNKTYDGTTVATLGGVATISAIGGDAVSVTGSGIGAFADKNAGTGKAVAVNGYTLSGTDAGNYTLVLPANLTADIARASLVVSGVSATSKTYDGTTSA
ncbi:filamentous hemagglutinin, partial|uniref:YDG domain-containing protein n=1 Tax=Escherichia coli TaxID=562 RepID=UPI0016B03EE4